MSKREPDALNGWTREEMLEAAHALRAPLDCATIYFDECPTCGLVAWRTSVGKLAEGEEPRIVVADEYGSSVLGGFNCRPCALVFARAPEVVEWVRLCIRRAERRIRAELKGGKR